jgi:DNA polymerase/3'-5' exonuclease PolX
MADKKQDIIDNLEKLRKKEIADKQPYKARAYANVVKQLKQMEGPITKYDDMKHISGVGKSIEMKIKELLETGHLKQVDEYESRPELKVIESLLKIHAIGPAKAKQLVEENGIRSIDDLKQRPELLNDKQKIGLKYWEHFDTRIPRVEMEKHNEFIKDTIKKIDENYIVELAGSFRRNEKDSGDIDVLITHPDGTIDHDENFKKIIEAFVKSGYVTDIFAQGPKKCLAVCKAKRHRTFRRVDFMMTHKNEFPFALLYFTGSGGFNVNMRNLAIEKGYSLNEYGLKCLRGPKEGDYVNAGFESEKDIFDFLGIQYIPPNERTPVVAFQTKE